MVPVTSETSTVEPEYSRTSFTSKMVMTLPFRWETSTSPSLLTTLLILALVSPSAASILVRLSSNHCFAQAETSLLTQCQLLGLCRTIFSDLMLLCTIDLVG